MEMPWYTDVHPELGVTSYFVTKLRNILLFKNNNELLFSKVICN